MVYEYICDDLKHASGAMWSTTTLERAATHNNFEIGSPARTHQSVNHDCTIMQTCRQVHAEFAIKLYERPLQIKKKPDVYTLPITKSCAHLLVPDLD